MSGVGGRHCSRTTRAARMKHTPGSLNALRCIRTHPTDLVRDNRIVSKAFGTRGDVRIVLVSI